jgi:hypothetical protein
MINAYKLLVGNPEERKALGRPTCKWEDNIQIDLKRNRMCGYRLDSTGSGWRSVMGSCEHGNESLVSIKVANILST